MSSLRPAHPPAPGGLALHLVILIGLVSAIGPLSTDMYLPAFPKVDHDLGAGSGAAQMTLAIWFWGLALGQFFLGALSDRYGRRTPLLWGLAIFTLGTAGCAFVSDFWAFCLCRFVASLGASTSAVVPRAIVRDVASGPQGARIMSQLALVGGLMPIVAPSLGGLLLHADIGWRWIFWLSALYGIAGMAGVFFLLPDTLDRQKRIPFSVRAIFWRYILISKEGVYTSNTLISSFGLFIILTYLGGAPVIFEQLLGFSPLGFAVIFGLNSICLMAGTQINAHLTRRAELGALLNYAVISLCGAGLALVAVGAYGAEAAAHPVMVCIPFMWIMFSLGFILPNSTVLAFTHHASHAGSASALMGTAQFALGSVGGVLLRFLPGVSVMPTACVIMLGVGGMAMCNIWRAQAMKGHVFE